MATDGTTPDTADNAADPADAELIAREELSRRRSIGLATDNADASHEGGMGAQGGAADFGNPSNFAGS